MILPQWKRVPLSLAALLLVSTEGGRIDAAEIRPDESVDRIALRKMHDPGRVQASDLRAVQVHAHYENGIGSSQAASEGVVNGALLRDIPLLRPAEAMETIPGLIVTQHSGDGKANQYFLRGYNLDHGTDFATGVDGVPVNMPSHAHGQGYTDLNFLIPELVDAIHYHKGPYDATHGDFAAAGSADIRYRTYLDHDVFRVTYGSYAYRRILAAGSLPLAGKRRQGPVLLAAAELVGNNGPWRPAEHLRKVNLMLRLSDGDAHRGWSIDAIHYMAHWNSVDQVPLSLVQTGALGRYQALDPSDGGKTGRDILSAEWHQHSDHGYTHVSAYAEHYRLSLWSDFTFNELRYGQAPQEQGFSDQFRQGDQRNMMGGSLSHGWFFDLFGHSSTFEIGGQVRHDHVQLSLAGTQARQFYRMVSDNRVDETSAGVYIKESTAWTSWLNTEIGVREDLVSMDMRAITWPVNSGHAAASQFSPKLAIVLGPWADTEFFLDAGKGFHSNDARGVIDRVDPTDPATLPARVPVLASAIGKEIGVRSEVVPGLQTSLALWQLDSQSEIIYSADSAIGSTEPEGASKRYGVEWSNHYMANRWLLLDANLAWTHARYASAYANGESGQWIPNAISKVARVGLTLHDMGPWLFSAELRYFGGYPLNQDGSLRAPSTAVTNLRLQRQLGHGIEVSLDVLNLANRRYYDMAYEQDYRVSGQLPVVPDGVTVHPGEPREFRLSFGIDF